MSASLAQANAELILTLAKLGVYMERDRAKLDTMSPSAQNTRLRKALDRAVDNCCVFQLFFSKEQREMGKLVLSDLPEWDSWRVSRKELYRQRSASSGASVNRQLETFVKTMGTHSLYAPFRMGRSSVTDSALFQGASVRRKDDVPDLEELQLRWLGFATMLDIGGDSYSGGFFGLAPANTNGTSYTAPPSARTACLAIQPLNVFEVQFPDDVDDVDNESGDEPMKKAGYRGNDNRRAIPIIVVRYATALPSLGSQKNVKSLMDFGNLSSFDPRKGFLTPVQLLIFSHLLESNSRRLSPSEVVKYQAHVPKHIAKETKISFFSPLYCPGANLADQLEIGRRPRLSCAVCEVELGPPDVKLSFCAACSGVTYCSSEHQSADWPSHKALCRSKTSKLPLAIHKKPANSSSPIVKVLLPLEYRSLSDSFGPKFVNYINPAERLKPPRKFYEKPQPAKTVYAHGERFLVRARWGGHADRLFGLRESDRRSGNIAAADKEQQDQLNFFMTVLHFVDRPASLGILLQRQTGLVGTTMILMPNAKFPDRDVDNSVIFDAVVNIIRRSPKDKAEAAYFWATRKGDCIEVDLEDLPDQGLGW
ncbi:hypothetical protein C8R44DRAFT_819517 [Mycena epipterygia]|nr:hypothetical protein C8R44DRAFT_819517 [Mycena epipterygia]